jgi:hypothetical protein
MKKLKLLFFAVGMCMGSFAAQAQAQETDKEEGYTQSAGFVGHYQGGGLSYKRFIKTNHAVEGWLTTNGMFTNTRGFKLTGLYQIHAQAFEVEGLSWFYGGGAHFGAYRYDADIDPITSGSVVYLGVDGVGGLEYQLKELPINVGLIYNPMINVVPAVTVDLVNVKAAVRYIF